MVAFLYRMGSLAPGVIGRTHPQATIEPCAPSTVSPPTAFGQAVVVDQTNQGVRPLGAADTAVTVIWGVTVKPYPYQQAAATNYGAIGFGSGSPAPVQPIDVARAAYIGVAVPVGQMPIKGGPVFVWIAASTGSHVQGGFEAVATGGSTIALDPNRYQFNGSPDANGYVELMCNL